MPISKLEKDLNVIRLLADEPNDTGANPLTSDELKSKFDEAGNEIKDYINNTLALEIDAELTADRTEIANNLAKISAIGIKTEENKMNIIANKSDISSRTREIRENRYEIYNLRNDMGYGLNLPDDTINVVGNIIANATKIQKNTEDITRNNVAINNANLKIISNTMKGLNNATIIGNLSTDVANIEKKLENYSSYATNKDDNGIYTQIYYRRSDSTLYMWSYLSNPNTNGNYRTNTWQFYNEAGDIINTITWTISYDADGNIISKEVR